jgi:hypothetical protein
LDKQTTSEKSHSQWLLLTDYAVKYRVSVSTLRRRIKANSIRHRFDDGRYFLFDEAPLGEQPMNSHSSHAELKTMELPTPHSSPNSMQTEDRLKGLNAEEGPILSTATRLLNELKRAYMSILQEKEEQLIQVKEEVSDLKTLVRVLESDNERLRRLTDFQRDL